MDTSGERERERERERDLKKPNCVSNLYIDRLGFGEVGRERVARFGSETS